MTTTVQLAGETYPFVLHGFEGGPVHGEFTAASIPGTGVLTLTTKRPPVTTYAVGPGVDDDGGRAFRLVKVGGGSDKDMTTADVLVSPAGQVSCCCRGYQRWVRCKHSAAVALILTNNWLPEPRYYRDDE